MHLIHHICTLNPTLCVGYFVLNIMPYYAYLSLCMLCLLYKMCLYYNLSFECAVYYYMFKCVVDFLSHA